MNPTGGIPQVGRCILSMREEAQKTAPAGVGTPNRGLTTDLLTQEGVYP